MAEQHLSRLLLLPAEIRLAIWELIMIHDQNPSSKTSYTPNQFHPASLLRTCKQINHETTPILYQSNTFLAHPTLLSSLPSFLLRAQPTRLTLPPVTSSRVAQLIKKFFIHVRLDVDPRFSSLQATESFTGVESLEIEVFQSMYGSCDFTNLRLFENVRGVGKAVVQGSIGDGNYAKWLEICLMSPVGSEICPYTEKWVGGSKSSDAWQRGIR
ncbi:uncharacterized protein RCC_09315 [Ramularia collo-cygni]|uniref:F-box domain-containing protein n=1 Tax=Ramularia collo-cygni TaxID=112498 RepID=A0A2D3VHC3_9PEZI|nr:uncharacterized protein RCC_09315 [Ramularia collo-cygni]CZT23601.1 uncharacterized protein RCC_09315 [Ramularia collo-cygni]